MDDFESQGVAQPVLVCAVLLGLLTQTPAASPPDEGPPISIQDIVSFLDYLQNKGMNPDLASSKEHGFIKRLQDFPESSVDLGMNEFNDQDGNLSMEKRASYMTLCHFKICNMGRKRGFIRKSTHNLLRRL